MSTHLLEITDGQHINLTREPRSKVGAYRESYWTGFWISHGFNEVKLFRAGNKYLTFEDMILGTLESTDPRLEEIQQILGESLVNR